MAARKRASTVPTKPVRLETFDMQGHNGPDVLDYRGFFDFIAGCRPELRREESDDRILAMPSFYKVGDSYAFVAYSGSSDPFLILNLDNNEEEMGSLEKGKIIATRTIGLINPSTRRAVIQYVHTGLRAPHIAALMERICQRNAPAFSSASLEFAPVPRVDFARELAALERIKSASITLTRPNADWDDFSSAAMVMGQDSGAQNLDVSASAPRNGSLNKSKGIIQGIKESIADGTKNILKKAVIEGFRGEGESLTTLNLNKFIEAKTVAVPLGRDGLANTTAVITAAVETINEIPATE